MTAGARIRSGERIWNVPNLISGIRLALMPVLIALAAVGWKWSFLVCLVIALLSDALDGFLARRWDQVTQFGASLDSWADAATWIAAVAGAWFLWPELVRREWLWLVTLASVYVLTIAVGAVRFRRLTSYHTWGAKVSAVLMSVAGLALFLTGKGWPLHVGATIMMVACLEELAITFVLPAWRCDVPSLWHAVRIRREGSGLA